MQDPAGFAVAIILSVIDYYLITTNYDEIRISLVKRQLEFKCIAEIAQLGER